MGLFSSLLQQDQKNHPSSSGGGFFNRLLDIGGEAAKVVTNPIGAATDLLTTAATHPDQTKAVIKGVQDTGVDVARSVPRSAASLLLSSGALQSDTKGKKELQPSTYGTFAKTLLGSEPIEGVTGEGEKTAKAFGAGDETAKTFGKYGGLPLAVTGLLVNPESLTKSGLEKALVKASTAEDVARILGKANVDKNIVQQVAPTIAASKSGKEIKGILKAAQQDASDTTKVGEAAQAVASRVTNPGSPNVLDLRDQIAKSAVEAPAKPGFEGAKEAITPLPRPVGVGHDITLVDRGGANIASRLEDSRAKLLQGLPDAPEAIRARLTNPENVIREKNKSTFLNNLRPSADVAGDFLGSTGTNMVYKLAQGADQERQIIDTVTPHTDVIKDLVYGTGGVKKILPGADKGAAKTKAGQVELSKPIVAALNDRANADSIIAKASETNPSVKKIYDEVVQVFDKIKAEREKRGLATLNDYSPRALLKDSADTQDSLLHQLTSAFNPDVKSAFSKKRVLDENAHVNPNIFEVLPGYVASQTKELGYSDATKYVQQNISKVDPSYLSNPHNYQTGLRYMQNLAQDLISPDRVSKTEQIANKLIGLKYKSDLRFALKSSLQNRTQKWYANAYVSKDAEKLAKSLSKDDQALIDSHIIGSDQPISGELGAGKKSTLSDKIDKIDPFVRSEKGNVSHATRVGAMEEVLRSPIYQDALKQGSSKTEAITAALGDQATLERAVRRGNVVSNATQFNGNKALKAAAFREGGNVFGIPTGWLKQYRTFQTGMINNLYQGLIATGKTRELNIIKNGDPREVGLVTYARTARSVDNYLADLEKAAKNGEVSDLTSKEVASYRKELGRHLDELNKQIAQADPLRRGKVAKNLAAAWGSAFAIQTLFDGSLFDTTNFLTGGGDKDSRDKGGAAVAKNLRYSSPINIPTKSQDITSLTPAITKDKPGNLIPGVGSAVKRGKEIGKLVESLSGQSTASKGSGR